MHMQSTGLCSLEPTNCSSCQQQKCRVQAPALSKIMLGYCRVQARPYLSVTGVQGGLDGDDELRNDWQDFAAAGLQHVLHTLDRQKLVRLLSFPDPIEEDGQVVVVVQLAHIHLCPRKLVF